MTQEQIIAGNKLIAEFMGMKKGMIVYEHNSDYGVGYYDESELLYHTSWDWLMPVVEKIESSEVFTVVLMEFNKCGIKSLGGVPDIIVEDKETKLQAVYTAVLSFIKWHNQQQK